MKEESTCDVEVDRLVGVCTNASSPQMVIFTFTGRHVRGTPRASDETIGAGWFTLEEALACVAAPGPALRLRDALEAGDRPRYRAYTHEPFAILETREL